MIFRLVKRSNKCKRGVRFGTFVFSPSWFSAIITLLLLVFLVNLGEWQLRRAEFKENLIDRLETRSQLQTRSIDALIAMGPDISDYPVFLKGKFINERSFLLDNRVYKGRAGYQVITPLVADEVVVLVNRGWIAAGSSRAVLPDIPLLAGEREVDGLIHVPNPNTFVLKEDSYSHVEWPFVIQKVNMEKIALLFDMPLAPFVIRLHPDTSSKLVREWYSGSMGPEKHYGYAFQWFCLAITLLAIFLGVNTKKIRRP